MDPPQPKKTQPARKRGKGKNPPPFSSRSVGVPATVVGAKRLRPDDDEENESAPAKKTGRSLAPREHALATSQQTSGAVGAAHASKPDDTQEVPPRLDLYLIKRELSGTLLPV